jgi:hypothetical protein
MTRSNAGIKTGKTGELSGGQNGDIPYQSGPDTTEFANGVGLVYSNGFGAPVISDTIPASVYFPNATSGVATNLGGGTSGQIPYQSAVDTTSFASGPGLVYALPGGPPIVSDTITASMQFPNTLTGYATNLDAGVSGAIPYQTGTSATSFVTGPGLVYANSSGQPTVSNTQTATMSLTNTTVAKSNNLVGSTTNTIPYQSGTDTTSFLPTTPGILTRFVNNGLPVFQDVQTFVPTIIKSPFAGGGSLLSSFAYTVQEGWRQRVNGYDMIMIRIQGTPTLTGGGIGIGISCDITFNRNFFMAGIEFTLNSYPGITLNGRASTASNVVNVYTSNLSLFSMSNGVTYGLTLWVTGYSLI